MFARFRRNGDPAGSGSRVIGGSRRGAGFGTLLAALALLVGVLALAAASSSESGEGVRQVASKRCSSAQVGPIRARDCRRSGGQRGPRGLPGPKGDAGPVGPQGPLGLTGPQGERGPQGFTGLQGPKGDPCPPTDAACKGPQGNPGMNGTNGTNGGPGPQGPPGISTVTFAGASEVGLGNDGIFRKVVAKDLPAGSWAIVATVDTRSGTSFSGDRTADAACQLRNATGNGIGGATDRREIPDSDLVKRSLSMNGGAQIPAGGGEVSVWCLSQSFDFVVGAQMMMLQVGGFS